MAKEFVEEYLGGLEKRVAKKLKEKQKEKDQKISYKFCYADVENKVCIDTIMVENEPQFVLWDGKEVKFVDEFKLPYEELLMSPPVGNKFYRGVYKRIIVPDKIIKNEVTTELVDNSIDEFLKSFILLNDVQYTVVRNWIKQTWVYERFNKNPYLYIYGDWGTGKSKIGRMIMMLSHYGYVLDSATAASLARTLDFTNSSVMLEEAEYLEGEESGKVRTMLRNGYERGGFYQVAEQEAGKKFMPQVFCVDQPKILVKRLWPRDDALASRCIPMEMTPRDSEIPRTMRLDIETSAYEFLRTQARAVVNLLLKWRWQNIFLKSDNPIVDDMNIRFNDTIAPLLKVATLEDKEILINFMKRKQKETIADISDDFHLQIVKAIAKIYRKMRNFMSPSYRMFLTDIISECSEEYAKDLTEVDFKKFYHPRTVKRALKNLGFSTDLYKNKVFIKRESLSDLLIRLCSKYSIPLIEEENEEELEQKQQEAEDLLALDIK